jgi:hypothetical protein
MKDGKTNVYLEDYLDANGRRHTRAYTQCSRPCFKPKDSDRVMGHCHKHHMSKKDPVIYDALIMKNGVRLAEADDAYFSDKNVSAKSAETASAGASDNSEAIEIYLVKNPSIAAKLKKALSVIMTSVTAQNVKPTIEPPVESDSDEEMPAAAAAAASAEVADIVEEDDDDDSSSSEKELECKAIKTVDGRELLLDEDTGDVYSQEVDSPELLGRIYEVTLKKAPLKIGDKNCIVGQPFSHEEQEYIKCVLSNNLFQKDAETDSYQKVGTITKGKKGDIVKLI